MSIRKSLALFFCLAGLIASSSINLLPQVTNAQTEEEFSIKTRALTINVDDMKTAEEFYIGKLGFEIEDRSEYPKKLHLKTGNRIGLVLQKVERLQRTAQTDSQVGLTLQVNDLDTTIVRMKSMGVEFAESAPRKEGVGNAISIRDPFGRRISLMHQTIVKVEPFKEPRIYNFGLLLPDMNAGREFYSNKLGFVVRSEKYLPLDLPLGHKDKSFAFMLHYRPGVRAVKGEHPKAQPFYMIVFETNNMGTATAALTKNGVEIVGKEVTPAGKPSLVYFRDPFGNISELRGFNE